MQELPPFPENQPDEPTPDAQNPSTWGLIGVWLVELGETILPAVVIAILINLFLAQATRVYGSSMEPNLHTDQRLVVEKVSYRLHDPQRGDVVVIRMPERGPELLIKRIIALPGETIEIKNGLVFINGTAIDEPYLTNDSRVFGPVELERVVGRAWVSYWPPEYLGRVD